MLGLQKNKMDFAQRLRDARTRAGVTQQQLADHVGLTHAAISKMESGKSDAMLAPNLFAVAEYLGVDAKWLALGDGVPEPTTPRTRGPNFGERFRWARSRAGVTQQQVADKCGLSNRAVSSWEREQADGLLAKNVFAVADFLGVDARWLATGEGLPELGDLANAVAKLSNDQQNALRIIVDGLIESDASVNRGDT
jgi:transcriptional regulator with XRE-family HTH domain